ncbi:MAG: hypothetical protein ABI584_11020 [Acidobacteriota bacterium]
MNERAPVTGSKSTLDSDRLFDLQAEVRSAANSLIYSSSVIVLYGIVENPLLIVEGVVFLVLSIVLRFKQSRSAALTLLAAIIAAVLSELPAIVSDSPSVFIGFDVLLAAALPAYNVILLERLLRAPLTPARHGVRGV